MRAIADGELELSKAFADEMSYCLGCLACTSACPAGVDYVTLFETARAASEESGVSNTFARRWIRRLTLRFLFMRPWSLRSAGRALWLYQASGFQSFVRRSGLLRLAPKRLRALEPSTPVIRRKFSDQLIAPVEPSRGERRYRVALLSGCVQSLVLPEINRATVDVLVENGCEVWTPHGQHCCGSLHAHNGDSEGARILARRQIDMIDPFSVDAIISNAGGCGSHLKHYADLLADDPEYAERGREWSRKLKDISEWLVETGFRVPASPRPEPGVPGNASEAPAPTRVTYHDSCHLCHGQGVREQPRALLRAIPGLDLKECAESNWCCGSAGIYSITQPETATRLQQRKIGHLLATGANVIAMANPGCHLHIQNGLATVSGPSREVTHPVVLLAAAYRNERATSCSASHSCVSPPESHRSP